MPSSRTRARLANHAVTVTSLRIAPRAVHTTPLGSQGKGIAYSVALMEQQFGNSTC